MRRIIYLALVVCATASATMAAWAEGPKQSPPNHRRPQRQFEPMRLFDRLDADENGVIALEELRERLPERLKEMLVRADADGDGKVTREEYKAAFEAERKRISASEGAPKERRARSDLGEGARERPSKGERPGATPHPSRTGPPRRTEAVPPHRPAAARPAMPDLKALFVRMDRDRSGELSLEEFTEGMRRLRERMVRWHAQVRPPMGPPPSRRPGPSCRRGPSGPPRGSAARPAEAKPRERPEAAPKRAGRSRDEKPDFGPERGGRSRGEEPDARPNRRERPRGETPREEPADEV